MRNSSVRSGRPDRLGIVMVCQRNASGEGGSDVLADDHPNGVRAEEAKATGAV
jgi:hypothetical protein